MIITTSLQGAIEITGRSTMSWYGNGDLAGSSFLGIVAPAERLAALRFIEQLSAQPDTPMNTQLQLLQRSGKVTVCTVLGARIGASLAIQCHRRSHSSQPDESLLWITAERFADDPGLRPLVMAMVAGSVGHIVAGSEACSHGTTVTVSLPPGMNRREFAAAHRAVAAHSPFDARVGNRRIAIGSEVRGVHFDDEGVTSVSPSGVEVRWPWVSELRR